LGNYKFSASFRTGTPRHGGSFCIENGMKVHTHPFSRYTVSIPFGMAEEIPWGAKGFILPIKSKG
jgi:hypothetical protein